MRGVELGIDTFDCAMPTRLGRHGVALVPDPERRWRVDLAKARAARRQRRADPRRLPVPGLRGRLLARATCATCSRRGELLGQRLVTLHNLTFVSGLMADLRAAIAADRLAEGRRRVQTGLCARRRARSSSFG